MDEQRASGGRRSIVAVPRASGPLRRELRDALAERVGETTHVIAAALAVYGAYLTIAQPIAGKPIALAYISAAFVPCGIAVFVASQRSARRERARWAHPFIFCVAALALVRDVVEIRLTGRADPIPFELLLIGAAVVMLDTRWYAAVIGAAGATWAGALVALRPLPNASSASLELVSSAAVGVVMHLVLVRVHRQREAAIAKGRLILDAVSDVGEGWLLTDGKRILETNAAYLALAHRTEEEILALTDLMEWTPEEDRAALRARLRERLSGGSHPDHYDARLIRGDGNVIDVEVGVRMISPHPPRIFSVVRDITARKQVEAQMREAQELKNRLTAGLSHDIRTPLASIIGFTEVLRTRWSRLTDDERDIILQRLGANAGELEDLIDRLLDYARLEHDESTIAPERILLPSWLREWVETKAPVLRDHAVRLDIPEDVEVVADERALSRMVGNLVGNAVKFSAAGSAIEIGGRREDAGALLWVRDHGPGLPPEVRSMLFQPFSRGAAPGTRTGIGMGLAIVKRYVDLHGGRVWVQSTPGEGTTFFIRLPMRSIAA